ncbi:MAG: hypothetical protein R2822_03275 [Spirosomataceae bacterium]
MVVSDGDLIVNDIDYKRDTPLPLGYDRLSGTCAPPTKICAVCH